MIPVPFAFHKTAAWVVPMTALHRSCKRRRWGLPLAALGLAAVLAAWGYSYHTTLAWHVLTDGGHRFVGVVASRGRVAVASFTFAGHAIDERRSVLLAAGPRGVELTFNFEPPAATEGPAIFLAGVSPDLTYRSNRLDFTAESHYDNPADGIGHDRCFSFMGFAFLNDLIPASSGPGGSPGSPRCWERVVQIPHWFAALSLAALTAAGARRSQKRRRRDAG